MRLLSLCLFALAGCTPTPSPERQHAEYTIKTATPTIGALAFAIDGAGLVTGSLELDAALITSHPLRVGSVWLKTPYGTFLERLWQSILIPEGQASIVMATSAGSHSFSLSLPTPPMDSAGNFVTATLVAYVDVNENGVLDLSSSGPLVDHVLASTNFPQLALGHLGNAPLLDARRIAQGSLPVFDDPLLDLVACNRPDRFAVEQACGIPVFVKPRVSFSAELDDERTDVWVEAQENDQITIDAEPYVLTDDHAKLATGQHLLRVVGPSGGAFEATFMLPDRIEVTAIRSAGFTAAGAPQHDIELKKLTGASVYEVRSARSPVGSSLTPTVRVVGFDTRSFAIAVAFPQALPFQVNALYPKR